jgi:hypothetical protein
MKRYRSAQLAVTLATGVVLVSAVTACSDAPRVNPPPSASATAAAPAATDNPAADANAPGTRPGGGHAPAPAGNPVVCNTGTLAIALGPGDAGAGTVYAPLQFTNRGSRPCVIQGFPGVSYVTGDNGNQVGAAAQRDGARPGPVIIPPGGVASATLAMVQVLNFDQAVCRPTPVRGLRVYPPAERASLFVPIAQGTGCAGNPPSPQLRVTAVKAGTGQN